MKTIDHPNDEKGRDERSLLLSSSSSSNNTDDWKFSVLSRQREKLMAIHKEFFIAATTTTTSPLLKQQQPPPSPQRRSARNSAHPPKKYYIPEDDDDEDDAYVLLQSSQIQRDDTQSRHRFQNQNRSPRKQINSASPLELLLNASSSSSSSPKQQQQTNPNEENANNKRTRIHAPSTSPLQNRHSPRRRQYPRIRTSSTKVETNTADVIMVPKPEPVLDASGLFGKRIRSTLEEQHPHVSHVTLRGMIWKQWNQLSSTEKLPYEQQAQQLQTQYRQQVQLYQEQQQQLLESSRSTRKRTNQSASYSLLTTSVPTKRSKSVHSVRNSSRSRGRSNTTTTTTTADVTATTSVDDQIAQPSTTTSTNRRRRQARSEPPSTTTTNTKNNRRKNKIPSMEQPPRHITTMQQVQDSMLSLWEHRDETILEKNLSTQCTTAKQPKSPTKNSLLLPPPQPCAIRKGTISERVRKQQQMALTMRSPNHTNRSTTTGKRRRRRQSRKELVAAPPSFIVSSITDHTKQSRKNESKIESNHFAKEVSSKSFPEKRIRELPEPSKSSTTSEHENNTRTVENNPRHQWNAKKIISVAQNQQDERIQESNHDKMHVLQEDPLFGAADSQLVPTKPTVPTFANGDSVQPKSSTKLFEDSPIPKKNNNCNSTPSGILRRKKSSANHHSEQDPSEISKSNRNSPVRMQRNAPLKKSALLPSDFETATSAPDHPNSKMPTTTTNTMVFATLVSQSNSAGTKKKGAPDPSSTVSSKPTRSTMHFSPKDSRDERRQRTIPNPKRTSHEKNNERTSVKDTVLPKQRMITNQSNHLRDEASTKTTAGKDNDSDRIPLTGEKMIDGLPRNIKSTTSKSPSPKRSNATKEKMGRNAPHVGDVDQVQKCPVPDHPFSPPNSQTNGKSCNEIHSKQSRASLSTHSSLSVVSGSTLAPKVVYVSPEPRYIACGHCAGCLTIRNCRRCLQCMLIAEGPPKLGTGAEQNLVCIQRICTQPILNPKHVESMPSVSFTHTLALGTMISQVSSPVTTPTMDESKLPINTSRGLSSSERISSDAHSVLESLCDDDDDIDEASDLESNTPNDSKPSSHAPISGADLAHQLRLADQDQWDYQYLH